MTHNGSMVLKNVAHCEYATFVWNDNAIKRAIIDR